MTFAAVNYSAYAYWDLLVARDEGMLEDRGIEAEFIEVSPPANLVASVSSGDVDAISLTSDPQILAIDSGAPVSIVGASTYAAVTLVAEEGIDNYDALRGKSIAITDPNVSTTLMLLRLLEEHGIGRDDVDLVPVAGGTSDRFAALQSGAVDATVLAPPFDVRAESEGFNVLGSTVEATGRQPFTVYGFNEGYAEDNSGTVVCFLEAIAEAQAWLHDSANKDRAVEILEEQSGLEVELVEGTYETTVASDPSLIAEGGRFDDEEIDSFLDILAQATGEGPFEADDYFDWSYHDETSIE